jgi:polar amino acid transport system substrate-binding protein
MLRCLICLAAVFLGTAPALSNGDTLRVAYPAQMSPLTSTENGRATGLVPDILRAAAVRAGITLVFVPMSSGVTKALTSGSADAIAPMLITEKSEQSFDFTEAFVITGGGLFVRAPNPAPTGLGDLSGKTIATPGFGPFMAFIKQNFPQIKVVVTKGYAESLDLVLSGQADAAALNIEDGAAFVAKGYQGKITIPTSMFVHESLGLAVAKGQQAEIVRRLNQGLDAVRADGTLHQIDERWGHVEQP